MLDEGGAGCNAGSPFGERFEVLPRQGEVQVSPPSLSQAERFGVLPFQERERGLEFAGDVDVDLFEHFEELAAHDAAPEEEALQPGDAQAGGPAVLDGDARSVFASW